MRVNAVLALLTPKFLNNNFTRFSKSFLLILSLLVGWNLLSAQVSITQLGTPYTENFNSITTSNNSPIPSGFKYGSDWALAGSNTTQVSGTIMDTANLSGGVGGFYNFANGDNTSNDRAIGFFTNASYKSRRSILFAFTNNTGSTVTSINLSWNYEKYRNGINTANWNFFHGATTDSLKVNTSNNALLNATSLPFLSVAGIVSGMTVTASSGIAANTVVTSILSTNVGINPNTSAAINSGSTIKFSSTANTSNTTGDATYTTDGNLYITNPPTSLAKNITLNSLSIADGSTYYLRWTYYSGSVSNGNGPALGIDDFSISLSDGNCAPSVQGKIDSITAVTSSQMTLNYTRGNGDSVLIVASTNSSLSSDPANGILYTANSSFGSGTALGGGFVVYKDIAGGRNSTNNTVTITGLTSSTPYYYYIYEFNKSGTGAGSCYKIPSATYSQNTASAKSDYFRSKQSGQWGDPNTWESSNNNSTWVNATIKPGGLTSGILIKDSVILFAGFPNDSARLLTINPGAKLTYSTASVTSGDTLVIVDDGTAAFDFNIYGTYVVYGNPATLGAGATVKIFSGGLMRADANAAPARGDDFARFSTVYFSNGSVFEWNTTTPPQSSGQTYFNYNASQPLADIPTFRFSKSTSLGANSATIINGIIEVNARVTFQNTGTKTFRNGRIGSGNLIQAAGAIIFSENASWGGTGIDSLSINYGLRIASGKTTTLVSNKTIQCGPLYIDGTLDLSNNDLTFASSANSTASLGKMGASGTINYSGTGRFVVERYISTGTGANQHGKSWQLLATPTWGDNQTINAAWQEGATTVNQNPVSGYGTQITGVGGWTNGFDLNTPSPSMKSYESNSNSWIAVTKTDTTLFNKKGFMVFVRGDRSVTVYNQNPTPTVLRSRGKLYDKSNTPPSTNVAPGKLESVGNPFASAIDFLTVLSEVTSGSLKSVYYLWDPTLSSLGGWQTFDATSSYVPSSPTTFYPSSSNTLIQSGQAFFVNSISGGTVNFSENAKITSSRLVNRAPVNFNNLSILSSYLTTPSNNQQKMVDGNRIIFDQTFSNNIDENDAIKISNPGENFGINRNDTLISIEAKNNLSVGDTIFYNTSNLSQPNYQFIFVPQNIVSRGLRGLLVDKYLNIQTPISLTDSNFVNFTTTSDLSSKASDRFMLIFQRVNVTLLVRFLSVKANRNQENVPVINWNVENEVNIDRYELEKSKDGWKFENINIQTASNLANDSKNYSFTDYCKDLQTVYYRVKAVDLNGQIQYSKIISLPYLNREFNVKIVPNPTQNGTIPVFIENAPSGILNVQIMDLNGRKLHQETWMNTQPNNQKVIKHHLPSGFYNMKVETSNMESKTLRLIIN